MRNELTDEASEASDLGSSDDVDADADLAVGVGRLGHACTSHA